MNGSSGTNKEHLLSIGAVAKSFGVNPNTIRRIEAAGLLKPAYIASPSGYRYYDSNNVLLLAEILSLREYEFIYDDLKEYFKTPGDYSFLYNRLLEKRQYIDMMINKLNRRLGPQDFHECKLIQYAEATCRCRKVNMLPNISDVFDIAKEFLFDTIREGAQIDFTRSYMILSNCMDFRTIRYDVPQDLTFCIPVLDEVSDERDYLRIPESNALCCTWTNTIDEAWWRKITEVIAQEFQEKNFRQSDTCRIAFASSGYTGDDNQEIKRVIHFMVPIR